MSKPILCLDFDGVCHQYTTKWQGASVIADRAVPGLFDFLEEAKKFFDIQVFSTRSHQDGGTHAMMAWFLKERELWRKEGGRPPFETKLEVGFPTAKPPAYVGIDDRVITFEGVWPSVDMLRHFKPWNKREETVLTIGFKGDLHSNGELHRVQLSKDGVTMGFTLEQAKSLVSELSARLAE